jgi:hypothetical protein
LRNETVDAWVTRTGGMLAPVEFRLPGGRVASPLAVAPWAEEKGLSADLPPLLRALRGDFFCAPFGGNARPHRGERHPPHGEPANADWTLDRVVEAGDALTLHASLTTTTRKGRVDKRLTLRAGHSAVYCEHVLACFRGPMPVGTHPCVRLPEGEGTGRVAVGGWSWGQVFPGAFEEPAKKGYPSLKPGARFRRLDRVPLAAGGFADLTRYPARRGFEDLVMLVGDGRSRLGWSAVTFTAERFVFLQIKDPRTLRHTVLWHSNAGRHYPPWNGRHHSVLGVEEVTAYFHFGLSESARPNPISRAGNPTALILNPRVPTRVAHILAAVAVPRGFDTVAELVALPGEVELRSASGKRARAPLDLDFGTGDATTRL